ncbi:MAG: CxxxxCH/CxxCH domain-containing protein [Ignavibacteria bacterium]|nr:CxxxxCH/CxxCH domain-containing protein [Ignavibacteria bacterium]
MKKLLLFYLLIFAATSIIISFNGCSEVQEDLITAQEIGTHPYGWIYQGDMNFHGKYLYNYRQYNLIVCKQCHGNDYNGGVSGKTCFTCHLSSPEDCRLCHGDGSTTIYPPKALNGETSGSYIGVGTHPAHMTRDTGKRISLPVRCVACHVKLSSFEDNVHIGANPDNIAEVVFDSLSVTTTNDTTPNPIWNRNTLTCSGTYCHGNFKNGNFRLQTPNYQDPVWNNPMSSACGSCHGNPQSGNPMPGGTHPQNFSTCFCHSSVINTQLQFINRAKHINGIVNYQE